jgi:hypothetical protein
LGSIGITFPVQIRILPNLGSVLRKTILTGIRKSLEVTIAKTESFMRQVVPEDTGNLLRGGLDILRSERDFSSNQRIFRIPVGFPASYASFVTNFNQSTTNWTKPQSQANYFNAILNYIKFIFFDELNRFLSEDLQRYLEIQVT